LEEDRLLGDAVNRYGTENWNQIASQIPDRTYNGVICRWCILLERQKNLNAGNVDEKNPSFPGKRMKKYWQEEEDNLLRNMVEQNGPQNWKQIAAEVPGRTAKQCRERWIEQLDPTLKHGDWTEEEDQLLIEQHQLWGNRWVKIARNFPNRRDNDIKNRWNTYFLKRKRTNPRINQPSPESWGTASSFDFFDYSFDTENGDW
jgi:hypothetical protein